MEDVVTTEWLAGELGADDLSILDCSMFMAAMARDGAAEFAAAHIPGAQFLDLDAVSDKAHPSPHMLPPAAQFGAAMAALGIDRGNRIIVYDNSPLRSAARGWFMLRHFGAEKVAILDGGLGKWLAEGRPVESGISVARHGARFEAAQRPDVVDKAALLAGVDEPVVDARPRPRFEGSEPDPRAGIATGHIPGARNLPLGELYNPDGTFKAPDQLRAAFAAAGVDPNTPFIASCGSGVTANSIIVAARLAGGGDKARLYDGSWSEWGADPATPKAVGPA